jgi:hypothetical protein
MIVMMNFDKNDDLYIMKYDEISFSNDKTENTNDYG